MFQPVRETEARASCLGCGDFVCQRREYVLQGGIGFLDEGVLPERAEGRTQRFGVVRAGQGDGVQVVTAETYL